MASVKLWNTELGELAYYKVSLDRNGDVVCEHKDTGDMIKFPGGLTKPQFLKLVKEHNKANDGVKALDQSEIDERNKKNQKLINSL